MSYKALYRKWRPEFFRDVVGQEVIVRTLRAQITSGHIAHAYLFTGPRDPKRFLRRTDYRCRTSDRTGYYRTA